MITFAIAAVVMLSAAVLCVLRPLLRTQPALLHADTSITGAHRLAAVLALALPTLVGALYYGLGNPAALESRRPPAAVESKSAASAEQIAQTLDKLEERLKARPDDTVGWRILARNYQMIDRFDDAARAYQHLLTRAPRNADLLVEYAAALNVRRDQQRADQVESMLAQALQIDSDNLNALALAGHVAFQRRDYRAAIQRWQSARALLPAQSDAARALGRRIDEAQALATRSAPAYRTVMTSE